MLRRSLIAAAAGTWLAIAAPASAQAAERGYAAVNGLEMYYEIHGTGPPLVLLHGALMTLDNFGELLPALAKTRRVVAIEQQARGRTLADLDGRRASRRADAERRLRLPGWAARDAAAARITQPTEPFRACL